MLTEFLFEGLPGAELVHQGLVDLANGKDTVASSLIRIGTPRLRRLGLSIPETQFQPEHALNESALPRAQESGGLVTPKAVSSGAPHQNLRTCSANVLPQ